MPTQLLTRLPARYLGLVRRRELLQQEAQQLAIEVVAQHGVLHT